MDEKILIVEDDPDIADLLELNLRDAGYRTELAKNGLDGARMALENDFDLVCLDIMLPKLDGMEVLKRLEKDHEISEDDSRRQHDVVQKHTDETIVQIDKALAEKEAEIMQV